MKIIAYSTNKILLQHCEFINEKFKTNILGNVRKGVLDYIKDVFRIKVIKNETLFVYNTSLANLLTSMISRPFGTKVIFHLHDPIPHSGILNPIIYLLNFMQVLVSDKICIFSEEIRKDVLNYYILKNSNIYILPHGTPFFKYRKSSINTEKLNIGFFGRNLPYKNVNEFLSLSEEFKNLKFHIVGKGYGGIIINNNTVLYDGFIDNDSYYSMMLEMDYLLLPYKQVSFSGVISDCINLEKGMIVSDIIYEKYRNENMLRINEVDFNRLKKVNINPKGFNSSWLGYSNDLSEIIEKL